MMRCPNCQCRDFGKIGTNQYYCWGCFLEFSISGSEVKLYRVEEDGTLLALDHGDADGPALSYDAS